MLAIERACTGFEREPLLAPLGFKGGRLSELWQVVVRLEGASGSHGLGLATQSVLWSDASVFRSYSEAAGNAWMYLLTELACRRLAGERLRDPPELLDRVLPVAAADARRLLGHAPRTTFLLNALVALDSAAWLLLAAERGVESLDALLPAESAEPLRHRHERLAWVPLIPYGTPIAEVARLARSGVGVLKVKLGSDPAGDGDPEAMLAWDQERMRAIHAAVGEVETSLTESGRVLYYLDANGRYDATDRVLRLLDTLESIGALDRVLVLEEPFPEDLDADVAGLPVRVAADESAHTAEDAVRRIERGYGAVALKPVAKTLSMSLRILAECHHRGVPCFCADLTVNPVLLEWNKCIAARLAPMPGMRVGLLEANGLQHYREWERMLGYHPRPDAAWLRPEAGVYELREGFHEHSGGIFDESPHYAGIAG